MRLTFYGAADDVTGSCHLLETQNHLIMFDCGLFVGGELSQRNRDPLPFNPAEVDFLLLSHAHLDHCGRIPLLVKNGFRGSIIATLATYDLARLVMMDSARIQEEEARRINRKRRRSGGELVAPLYTVEDVLECLDYFDTFVSYDELLEIDEDVEVVFRDAGHILGSAFIELTVTEGRRRRAETRTIIYSGDLGNLDKPLIRDPQTPSEADIVILESTYGNRNHRPFDDSVDELRDAIVTTLERGGNVVIPSFALGRAQELLYVLHDFYQAGDLPACKIFLDSPMAINATRIFTKHGDCFDQEAMQLEEAGQNPFDFELLNYTRHAEDSKEINTHRAGAIIIAGSGMCTGGRILHHLKHNLWNPNNTIVFIGYAASGTLGRRIIDREPAVRIFGETIANKAQIVTIGGFSAHAGQQTLIDWVDQTGDPETVFLVHGEAEVQQTFARILDETLGMSVQQPLFGDAFDI